MAKELGIEITVDGTQAEQALKKFGGSIKSIRESEFEPLNFAIGELEDRLYEMAASGDTSSKTFREMSEEVARMKKAIIETDMVLDGMAQTTSQKVTGSIGGLAAGFELSQGAMAVFGVESAKVEEALLKVQSAMAISQGIQGIKEAIPSFKGLAASVKLNIKALSGFKKALIGTGIGAILVLLGELIANWDKYSKMLEDFALTMVKKVVPAQEEHIEQIREKRRLAREELKDAEKKLKAINKEIDALKSSSSIEAQKFDDAIRLAKAEGKSREEVEKIERKKLETVIKSAETEFELQKQKMKALRDEIKAKVTLGELTKEETEEAVDSLREQIETTKETYQALKTARVDLQVFNAERETEKRQEWKASADKAIEEEKRKNEELKKLQDEAKKQEEANRLEALRMEEELQELIYQAGLDAREKEITALNDYYFEKIEMAKQFGLDAQILEEEHNAKIDAINKKYEEEEAARKKAIDDAKKAADAKEIEDAATKWDLQFQLANDSLGAIGDLVTSLAGEGEAAQRKAFNVNKAISLAQAVISTAQGITAQLAVPQDALTGANFVKAGIVAATGAAQIATISRTKFQGGGSSVSSGSISSGSTVAQSTPATFNVVGNTGTNQLAETLGSSPIQAYVVSGDITTAQSLDRNKIEQSTL